MAAFNQTSVFILVHVNLLSARDSIKQHACSTFPDSIAVSLFVDNFVEFDQLSQKQIQITIQ